MYKKIQIFVLLSIVSGHMLNGMGTSVGKEVGERAAESITPTQQEGAQEFIKQLMEQFQGAAAQDVADIPVQASTPAASLINPPEGGYGPVVTTPLPEITGIEEQAAQTLTEAIPTAAATPSPDVEAVPGFFAGMQDKLSAAQERIPSLEQAKGMLPSFPTFENIGGKLPDLSSFKGMSARLPAVPSMATVTQALKDNPTLAAGAILGSIALGGYMMRNYLKTQAKSSEIEVFYSAVQGSLDLLENPKSTNLQESRKKLTANINTLNALQNYYTNLPKISAQIIQTINSVKIAKKIDPKSPEKAYLLKQIKTKADKALLFMIVNKLDTLYNFELTDKMLEIF